MSRNGGGDTIRRAAGYVRISALMGREQGADLLSDKIQREKIEAWAAYRGVTIVHWYIDLDVSGREGVRRPEFERMLADARDHRFEVVAVYRLTRFARSVKQAAESYSELRKLGVDLVSCTEDIDTTTASGKFMQNMLFAMAEFESERISEEWRSVHANRRARGIAHVARPMLGYQTDGAEIVGVDDAEAAAVRLIYNLRVQGLGYGAIRDQLRRAGHRTKRGGEQFPYSTISAIVRNPLYGGLVRTSDGELVKATHQAIVPRELWEDVQRLHGKATERNRFRSALLSGIVVCSGCGYRMRYDRRAVDDVRIYRCAASQRTTPCPNGVRIAGPWLDEFVEEAFKRRFDPKRMPHAGTIRRTRQQADWQRKAAKLRGRADELTRALDAIADQRFVKGSIATDEYERQFFRYSEERRDALEQAEDLERAVATVRPIAMDVLQLWPRMPLDVKQRALRLAIESVTVKPSPHRGRFRDEQHRRENMRRRVDIAWLA